MERSNTPVCEFCGLGFTDDRPNEGLVSRDYHMDCAKADRDNERGNPTVERYGIEL